MFLVKYSIESKITFDLVEVNTGNTENGFLEIVSNAVNLGSINIVTKGAYDLRMTIKTRMNKMKELFQFFKK